MDIDWKDERLHDWVIYVIWVCIWAYCVIGFWGQTYDDVYLAYVYAKNIIAGQGFVFNVGEKVLGTPAPLFVLLLVLFKLIFSSFSIPQIGSLISGSGLALAGLAVYRIGALTSQRLTGFIAGLLVVFNPYTVLTLGGETPLYLCFVLWAFYLYLTKRKYWASVLLSLALMNRSEAVVPIALLLCVEAFEKKNLPWKMCLLMLGVLTPWLMYAFLTFGTPLTESYAAKVSQISAGLPRYPIGLWRWSLNNIFKGNLYLLAALVPGVFGFATLLWAKKGWILIVVWCILQTVFYCLLTIPFYHWYAAQLGVFGAVLVGLGVVEIPELFRGTAHSLRLLSEKLDRQKTATFYLARRWTRAFIATSGLSLIFILITCYGAWNAVRGYQKFIPNHPSNLIYQQTGKWFAEHSAPGSRIAYLEIGQIAYYADRYIIDTLGLVTPGVQTQVAKLNWPWAFEKYKADYIIYNATFKDWINPVLQRPWFVGGFEEVAQVTQEGYPSPLVIYKRKEDTLYPEPTEPDIVQSRYDSAVGEIFGETIVRQTFVSNEEQLSGVELLFGTFARKNTGVLNFALLDSLKKPLFQTKIPIAQIQDNAWRRFDFPVIKDAKGKLFIIHVDSPDSQSGNALTLWRTRSRNALVRGNLYYGGKRQEGALAFKTYFPSH